MSHQSPVMTQHHAPLQVQTSENYTLAIISRDGPPLSVDSSPRGPDQRLQGNGRL